MTNLRRLARGMPCMVRLPGCDGGGETTVLAHYRLMGYSGIAKKPHDIMGAWACVRCHDLCDGRAHLPSLTRNEVRLAHAEGVMRTLAELQKRGEL